MSCAKKATFIRFILPLSHFRSLGSTCPLGCWYYCHGTVYMYCHWALKEASQLSNSLPEMITAVRGCLGGWLLLNCVSLAPKGPCMQTQRRHYYTELATTYLLKLKASQTKSTNLLSYHNGSANTLIRAHTFPLFGQYHNQNTLGEWCAKKSRIFYWLTYL